MNISRVGALAAMSLLLIARDAIACDACRGAEGVGGAVTATNERWAIQSSWMARRAVANWDQFGRAHVLAPGVYAFDGTTQLAVGVRVIRALELSIATGAGLAWFRAPGAAIDEWSWLDTTARARYELAIEDGEMGPPLGSAVWFGTRMPTGSLASPGAGVGTGAIGAFGLGTWEFAVGADLRHTFRGTWQPFGAVEGALRTPDNTFGNPRELGPRVSARAGLTYLPAETLSVSVIFDWAWESDVFVREQRVVSSWQQRTGLALTMTGYASNGLRTSVSLAGDLPIDGIGRNTDATIRLQIGIAYGAIVPAWNTCAMPTHGLTARADALRSGATPRTSSRDTRRPSASD